MGTQVIYHCNMFCFIFLLFLMVQGGDVEEREFEFQNNEIHPIYGTYANTIDHNTNIVVSGTPTATCLKDHDQVVGNCGEINLGYFAGEETADKFIEPPSRNHGQRFGEFVSINANNLIVSGLETLSGDWILQVFELDSSGDHWNVIFMYSLTGKPTYLSINDNDIILVNMQVNDFHQNHLFARQLGIWRLIDSIVVIGHEKTHLTNECFFEASSSATETTIMKYNLDALGNIKRDSIPISFENRGKNLSVTSLAFDAEENILVGTFDNHTRTETGKVYHFKLDRDRYVRKEIVDPIGSVPSTFGYTIRADPLESGRLAIGSFGGKFGEAYTGLVHLYRMRDENYELGLTLKTKNPMNQSYFGFDFTLHNNKLAFKRLGLSTENANVNIITINRVIMLDVSSFELWLTISLSLSFLFLTVYLVKFKKINQGVSNTYQLLTNKG